MLLLLTENLLFAIPLLKENWLLVTVLSNQALMFPGKLLDISRFWGGVEFKVCMSSEALRK